MGIHQHIADAVRVFPLNKFHEALLLTAFRFWGGGIAWLDVQQAHHAKYYTDPRAVHAVQRGMLDGVIMGVMYVKVSTGQRYASWFLW